MSADDAVVRMWEVRATPDGFGALLAWVCDEAVPAIEAHPRHVSTDVYRAPDQRIVVISKWREGAAEPLAEPPADLLARPPHAWDFTPVDR